MSTFNLQIRKMNLIEYLLGVQDEKIFDKIESNIQKSIKSANPQDIIFSKKDLIDRAEFSNNQISKGLVVSQKVAEEQAKNW